MQESNYEHSVFPLLVPSQISRSIGDAYLKKAEFNKPPLLAKFRIPDPIEKPILLAEPSIQVQKLQHEDQFLIYASDGLWEHLSNQEAVDLVHHSPRNVQFLNFQKLLVFLPRVKSHYTPITGCCQEASKSRTPGGCIEERGEIFGPGKDRQWSEETFPRRHHCNSPLP